MVAVRASPFGGMVPAVDDRLLQPVNAALAQNTWLYSGSAVGLPDAKNIKIVVTPASGGSPPVTRDLLINTNRVYRLPLDYSRSLNIPNSVWMEFTSPDAAVVRSQVISDIYDRYYFLAPDQSNTPWYQTGANLKAVGGTPGAPQTTPNPVSL